MSTLPLSPFTTADAVRGCIGVTNSELLDSMLKEQNLGLELEVDLKSWLPGYTSLYETGKLTGAQDAERLISSYITLYAQWFIAEQALNLMVLAIPQMISDGKSEMRRFQVQDIETLQNSAKGRVMRYKSLLQESQGVDTTASYSPVVRGIPNYDPISGI